MKKLIIFVLVFTFSNIVYADGTYGCVIGQSGGFDWVHGVWKLTKYSNNLFFARNKNIIKVNFLNHKITNKYAKKIFQN